jgi:7-carboxy-7-deazaguanine synthase
MSDLMLQSNLHNLTANDVIKFVVQNEEDMGQAYMLRWVMAQKYLSPVFGKIEPVKIVEFMKKNDMVDYKLQLQLHKLIWNPNQRGV